MKKIILTSTLFLFTSQVFSQNFEVPERTKALLLKMTASWCEPCGYYGFITENIYESNSEDILFVNCHVATSTVGDPYSGSMHNLLNGSVGIPAYNVCGNYLTAWPPSYDTIVEHSNAFLNETPQANIAFNYTITGNSITVNTTSKFFQNQTSVDDQYYVGAFIVENGITVNQHINGTYEEQIQNRVLRTVLGGSIEDLGLWGDQIAEGLITAGTTFDHQFTATLDPAWNQSNMDVVVAIWKRSNDVFTVLSSEDVEFSDVSVAEVNGVEIFKIFPNPAKKIIQVTLNNLEGDSNLFIYDVSGKLVFNQVLNQLSTNVNLEQLNAGVYHVSCNNSKQKIVIE